MSIDPTVAFRGLSGWRSRAAELLPARRTTGQAAAVPTIITVPDDSPVMGRLPGRPVLTARLLAANLSAPLAVQRAALAPVSQGARR